MPIQSSWKRFERPMCKTPATGKNALPQGLPASTVDDAGGRRQRDPHRWPEGCAGTNRSRQWYSSASDKQANGAPYGRVRNERNQWLNGFIQTLRIPRHAVGFQGLPRGRLYKRKWADWRGTESLRHAARCRTRGEGGNAPWTSSSSFSRSSPF
jgi:hypothetical protein